MKVLNAMQLKDGATTNYNRMGSITQPIQFLPRTEKTEEWCAWNMDWLEWNGLKQIRRNAQRLMKNYKLAKGVIDKSDYVLEQDNEMRDIVEALIQEDSTAFELKFYPIIPNVINVLVSEFAKRNTKVTYKAMDEASYNEMAEMKRSQVEEVLLKDAEQRMFLKMMNSGQDVNDPQIQQQMQQALSRDSLQKLPEIQDFFTKSYQGMEEQWAGHQHKVDIERFYMDELEERAFRDMLITDREFWHFKMMEDDYEVELWNPVNTFYHKSPDVRYVSQGNWVGRIDMMTVSDVIDKFGARMTQAQLESLEAIYPVRSAGYPLQGYQNDGNYYDATKSHDWNTNMPGLAYRQYVSMWDNSIAPGGDIINWLFAESEDYMPMGSAFLLRVTTSYWKSQVKVGHLTRKMEDGSTKVDIVSEEYRITDKPIYNTMLLKNKTPENLIFGEHIDWIWINHVYGGVKIGPNRPSFWGMNEASGITPIYLGINSNKIGPLQFQFKGDNNLYGCKLPVEGSVFSDRNTRSTSMVDLMKPYQIGYNIVNNQIADILVDELGTVILLDQNTLPRHSLGEDWGKNNLAKAYVAMKNFQMLPLDTTLANTEGALSFQHFQTLNLEQTQRMLSRVQLSNHFKQQCMEVIGITPQRLGQQLAQTTTAKEVEQAVVGSYAQTEVYFMQHSDYLMPRVHQMRTDLAQYYHSKNPSVRLSYITSNDEKVNFLINGTDLLLRDINVFATTNANIRNVLEQIKERILGDNTSGATIFDLGGIMQAETLADLNQVFKKTQERLAEEQQAEESAAEKLKQMDIEAKIQEKKLQNDHDALEREKDRRANILIAEIRAAGMGAAVDLNKNNQSDFMDMLGVIKSSGEFQQNLGLQENKLANQQSEAAQDVQLKEKELATRITLKEMDKEIAVINNNKAIKPTPKSKNSKTKSKK